jgi:hypothetical protein
MSWPAEVRALLAEVFGKKDDEKPAESKPKPYDASEGLKETRDHLRRVGAALAAGATTLLVGLGWTQLHHVFPPLRTIESGCRSSRSPAQRQLSSALAGSCA